MTHRIVVLGAGYAGTHTAGRLAHRLHPDAAGITLVNADPEFVERIRMHQLATGQRLRSRAVRDLVPGATVRTARVTAVDVDRKRVTLDDQDEIGYDTLVHALGSTAAEHGVPGVAEHAHHLAGKPAALRLRDRLAELAAGATVLVVGGGLTAIEAVTEIAESRPDLAVALATRGAPGDWLSDRARAHLRATLDRLGVTVHEDTDVVGVDAAGVDTAAGARIPADVTVWAAGFATHPIAAASTLEVAGSGQIVVDATMRSVSHPDVYAVGDAALAPGAGGKPLRMSCASGIPMAWRAADALTARLTGRPVPDAPIGYTLQCISLGRRDGIVQLVTPDDRMKPSVVTGWAAARVKEFICAGAGWSVGHPTVLLPSVRRRITAADATALSQQQG
jgi:NADH dehydrogenase FAD-containing subunit